MHEVSLNGSGPFAEHATARSMVSQHITDDNAAPTANAVNHVLDALWEMLSVACA
jgi:hypothetical protein